MSKKKRVNRNSRDAPAKRSSGEVAFLCSPEAWTVLCGDGYKPITQCAEVQMCINVYADAIANMTIMLLRNTANGDERIKDALSRKLDIEPARYMTHQTWVSNIVRVMMTEGNQITMIDHKNGFIDQLTPVKPSAVSFSAESDGYRVMIGGIPFDPEEVLHFPVCPDPETPWIGRGFHVELRDVVKSLRQANATKRALMESPSPSLIIKVDGFDEDMKTAEGRKKMTDQYLSASENGKPWLIPSDVFEVTQVKPLTLNDLAIKTNMELDKRTVAAMFGVPPFLVGVGNFNAEEYDWFISTKVMSIARIIEQELTRKLLYSPEMYFRFNNRSLLNYNLEKVNNVASNMAEHLALDRNEWRDWVGFTPREDMEELLALENYIPASRLGDQKKLNGGESNANEQTNQDGAQ